MQHATEFTKNETEHQTSSQVIHQNNNNMGGTAALSIAMLFGEPKNSPLNTTLTTATTTGSPPREVFTSFEGHGKRSLVNNDISNSWNGCEVKRQKMAPFDLTNDSYNSSSDSSFTGLNRHKTQKRKSLPKNRHFIATKPPPFVSVAGVLPTQTPQQENLMQGTQDSQDVQDSHLEAALRTYLSQINKETTESQQQRKSVHFGDVAPPTQDAWPQFMQQQNVKVEPQQGMNLPSGSSEEDQLQFFLAQSAQTLNQKPKASPVQPNNFPMAGQTSSAPGVNNPDTNLLLYALLSASMQNSNQQQQEQQPQQQSTSVAPTFAAAPSTTTAPSNPPQQVYPSCVAAAIDSNNANNTTSVMNGNSNDMTMLNLMLGLLNQQSNNNGTNSASVQAAAPPPLNLTPANFGSFPPPSQDGDAANFLQSLVAQQQPAQPNMMKTEQQNTKTATVPTKPSKPITKVTMEMETDHEQLSPYQVLIRQQLEYFVSKKDDTDYSVQGRKKRAQVGQVGIRCKYCSHLPHRLRGRGAAYYPSKLSGVYQAAQNMATNHLNQFCSCIPAKVREQLIQLRGGRNDLAAGAGKQYWAETGEQLGIIESPDGLHFKNQPMEVSPFMAL